MAHENTALFHLKGALAHVSIKEIALDLIRMLEKLHDAHTSRDFLPLIAQNNKDLIDIDDFSSLLIWWLRQNSINQRISLLLNALDMITDSSRGKAKWDDTNFCVAAVATCLFYFCKHWRPWKYLAGTLQVGYG